VERRLERRLNGLLGPAESYRVRILDTRDAELVLGRAHRVEVQGTRIHLRRQLMLERLGITFFDLTYEGGDPDILAVRRSDLEVEFTDAALNDYLKENTPRFEPEVRFTPDVVTAKIVYPFLGIPTPISATGAFEIREGRLLYFRADKADVTFLNTPGFGERFIEDRINPLLDLSRIDFPARLESIQVFQGRIRARGSAAIRQEVNR
jgi:hypothetical protein